MSAIQDSGFQAQPTNFPHEKSHPSQAQKLVIEPSFSDTGACATLLGTMKRLQVFKCLSLTDFKDKQGPHTFEDLSLCCSGLYLVNHGKLWYDKVQPDGDRAIH